MKKQILALALSLALGAAAAPASAAELCKAISGPVSGPWYASMGQMAKAVNTVYPDIKIRNAPRRRAGQPHAHAEQGRRHLPRHELHRLRRP